MSRLIRFLALLLLLVPFPASAAVTCADLLKALGSSLADVNCFASPDLTTTNTTNDIKTSTTPPDNSLPGLPAFAFTPITDRGVIAPSAAKRTPITKVVPGVQLNARIASDPHGPGAVPVCGCRTTGTAAWWSPARRERAASSTAISRGATTSCRRATPTRRRTRAC